MPAKKIITHSKPLWFPFYVQDWLASSRVQLMTPEQRGGYIQLLAHSFNSQDGTLPNNDDVLAQLSGLNGKWKEVGKAVKNCFIVEEDRIYNERLIVERKKSCALLTKRRKAGQVSGKLRQSNTCSTHVQTTDEHMLNKHNTTQHNEEDLSLSKTLSLTPHEIFTKTEAVLPPTSSVTTESRFDRFWEQWPKKISKKDAQKSWARLEKDGLTATLFDEIMTGLTRAKESQQWTSNEGQFIPHPATWLNGERWKDQHAPEGLGTGLWVDDFLRRHPTDAPSPPKEHHHDQRGVLERLPTAYDSTLGTPLRGQDGYGVRSS